MRSKAGYWIGGGLMVLALLGSILYGFLSLKQTARTVEAFQRVDLPGTATVELEARKYIIYAEGPGAAQSTPEVEVAVTDLRSQSPVSIRPHLTSLTYSFGTAGSAVVTVTPPQAGSYEIRASSTDGGPPRWPWATVSPAGSFAPSWARSPWVASSVSAG
ncbi:MAG: hypothetical protein KY451_02030 [Actinobacteria bacterium]|nr:hypothetical protein [Actinomycetota bacterium]MBW3648533.1 hypothetical protein [Actinomycetota bacterium]